MELTCAAQGYGADAADGAALVGSDHPSGNLRPGTGDAEPKVRLQLGAQVAIRHRFTWHRSGLRLEPELTLGLLACHILNLTQLKAVLVHEMAHLQHNDTLFILPIANFLQQLREWTNNTAS